MGRKMTLVSSKKENIWHIDKTVFGYRIRESTGSSVSKKQKSTDTRRLEEIRHASVYGVRPKRTFMEAAIKFLRKTNIKVAFVLMQGV